MMCVCVYRLSVVSLQKDDLHIATTCVRNVPKAAGKHICVCVCCYRSVYVSNKVNDCRYVRFCVWGTHCYCIFTFQRPIVSFVLHTSFFVSKTKLRFALKVVFTSETH